MWICNACTFENQEDQLQECSMCLTARKSAGAGKSTARSGAAAGAGAAGAAGAGSAESKGDNKEAALSRKRKADDAASESKKRAKPGEDHTADLMFIPIADTQKRFAPVAARIEQHWRTEYETALRKDASSEEEAVKPLDYSSDDLWDFVEEHYFTERKPRSGSTLKRAPPPRPWAQMLPEGTAWPGSVMLAPLSQIKADQLAAFVECKEVRIVLTGAVPLQLRAEEISEEPEHYVNGLGVWLHSEYGKLTPLFFPDIAWYWDKFPDGNFSMPTGTLEAPWIEADGHGHELALFRRGDELCLLLSDDGGDSVTGRWRMPLAAFEQEWLRVFGARSSALGPA